MRKRKFKVRYKQVQIQKRIFFSLPAVRLLLDALLYLEDVLIVSTNPNPNKPLAHETIIYLKTKLMDMLELEDWQVTVSFDYNEKHILNAALYMYLIYLGQSGDTEKIRRCMLLCQQFSKIVAELQEK